MRFSKSLIIAFVVLLAVANSHGGSATTAVSIAQRLASPGQIPSGLTAADWFSMRGQYERHRQSVSACVAEPSSTGTIAQQARLKLTAPFFAWDVAVCGDTAVVGVPYDRAAHVFVRSGTAWHHQAYLTASNPGGDLFGWAVAISGDTVVVTASSDDNGATLSGAAYVFVRNGTSWSQQAYLKASNPGEGDVFGNSVAIDGDTIVVGSYNEDSDATGVDGDGSNDNATQSGAAYVFARQGASWSQQAYLKASNTGVSDFFGLSVSVSGDTAVVGAPFESSSATGVNGDESDNSARAAGAAYLYVRNGTTWSQQSYLKASNTEANDNFGFAVAISGDTLAVGAPYEDSSAIGVNGNASDNSAGESGAVFVFLRNGTDWSEHAYLKASNTGVDDHFGGYVAIAEGTVVVAARDEDSNATGVNGNGSDNSSMDSGAAYVFVSNGTDWSEQAYLKPSINGSLYYFSGGGVSVSGDTVLVGMPFEGRNQFSGAAYVFTGLGFSRPHMTVEDQYGSSLIFGSATVDFGAVPSGASVERWFTITNTGNATLEEITATIDESALDVFEITGAPSATLAPGESSTFTLYFSSPTPTYRTVQLRITSNDPLQNPFNIAVVARSLSEQEVWRDFYFADPDGLGAGADAADPDGDGDDNLFEFTAGLDPTDPSSRFHLRIETVPDAPTQRAIIFDPVVAGRSYNVKWKANLPEVDWMPLTNFGVLDNGSTRSVIDLSADGPGRFYRIEITKP